VILYYAFLIWTVKKDEIDDAAATGTTMSMLTSLRTSNDKIEIIDQLLLPHTTKYVEITSVEEAHDAIKDMKVRKTKVIFLSIHIAFCRRSVVHRPLHH